MRLPGFAVLSVAVLILAPAIQSWADNEAHTTQARQTGSCPSCDLSGAYLKDLQSVGGDFSNAALQNANLCMARLTEASFSGADLSGADLRGADLSMANFSGANTVGAITDEATTCPDGNAGPCTF